MKKTTFKQTLFNAGTGIKNWGKNHAAEAATAALATATLGVGAAFWAACADTTVNPVEKPPLLLEAQIKPVNQDAETKALLKEITAKMDLTAAEIEQMCRDYDLPRDIFDQTTTPEIAK